MLIPNTELRMAFAGLGKVIPTRPSLPELGMIRLDRFDNGSVELTATDLDCHVSTRLKVECPGEAVSFLVPYHDLYNLVRSCGKTDTFEFEPISLKRLRVKVISGQTAVEHRFDTPPLALFPEIPDVYADPIPLTDRFRDSLLEAFQCASTDQSRYVLNGVCIDVSDKKCHHIVGTDGTKLFSSNSFTLPLKQSVIIPASRFLQWRGFGDDEWKLSVQPKVAKGDAPLIKLESKHWWYVSKTIAGVFPNWRRVIPSTEEFRTELEFAPDMMRQVIKIVGEMPDNDPTYHKIGIEVKRCNVRMVAQAQDGKVTSVEVPTAAVSGQDVTVYFNRENLVQAMRFGLHHMQIMSRMDPVRFHDEAGRQLIVMPVRHSDAVSPEEQNTPPPDEAARQSAPPIQAPSPDAESPNSTAAQMTGVEQPHTPMENPQEKPVLNAALDQLEVVKGSLRGAMAGLNHLSDLLRLAMRENKNTEREVRSVRQTLTTLQKMKF